MENDFSPHMPYTLGYSATSKSTDSLISPEAVQDKLRSLSQDFFQSYVVRARPLIIWGRAWSELKKKIVRSISKKKKEIDQKVAEKNKTDRRKSRKKF